MFNLSEDVLDKLYSLGTGGDGYEKLSRNYRERKFFELDISQAIAYAQGRMPATYSVIRYVLEKFLANVGCDETFNVLDVGAGVGTLEIALNDIGVKYVYEAVERSAAMREVFKRLHNDDVKIYFEDFQRFDTEKRYPVVFASYFINELKNKKQALRKIFKLSEEYVFIIEPGTPDGYFNILEAKKIANELNWYPLMPCAQMGCDLKKGDWCHFSVRLPRTKLHTQLKKAKLSYEDEKFCYVIFSKRRSDFVDNSTIIKNPIKRSGHTIFDICSKDGVCRVVSADKKKLKWGDQCFQSTLCSSDHE